MRVSDVFAMGGGYSYGQGDDRYGCESRRGSFAGCIPFDDPRYTRRGFAHIIGSRRDGSGLSGIFAGSDR